MKKIGITLLFVFATAIVFGQGRINYRMKVGEKFPEIEKKLRATDGNQYSLVDMKKKKGILIVFAANKCIAIDKWKDRLLKNVELAQQNNIGVVWINSNETQRKEGESIEDMKNYKEKIGLKAHYVQDDEFLFANILGVSVTPTSFLLDDKFNIVYQGVVDDNMMDSNNVANHYLKDAITDHIKGERNDNNETYGRGCRIPRRLIKEIIIFQ